MEASTFILLSMLLYALYYYFKSKLSIFDKHGIPYTPGWPILGNMHDAILRRRHMIYVLQELYNVNRDAKYVGVFDATRPAIMLRDLELIKAVTIKNFDNFPDHTVAVDGTVDPILGGNLFNMKGDKWKEARSLLSPAFTASKMKGMFELMVQCGENFVKIYLQNLDKAELEMVDTKDLFTRYTNDVIATCAFGISVDSLSEPENDFYVLGREAANFENFGFFVFVLGKLPTKVLKFFNLKFVQDHTAEFFKNLIGTTIATRDEKGIRRPDMIQLMMDARDKEYEHLKLDILGMTAQAFVFFLGGFESTAIQMSLIAHELAINPEVQAKLQEEIDEVLKKNGGKVTYEAINDMPYLDAVFNESMRMHTQFGFLNRRCSKEFELPPALPGSKPFTVKPGMAVWIPSCAIHHDPKYYENHEKFDPDRFFQKKVSINDVLNLGFGIGPRACIASRFAIIETKSLFFRILSKYSFMPNLKTCATIKYDKKSFIIKPEGGYWLSIKSRI